MDFERWNEVSRNLLSVVSNFRVINNSSPTTTSDIQEKKELLFWLQKERILRNLFNEYQEQSKIIIREKEDEEEDIEILQKKLFDLNINVENTKLLLKRIYQSEAAYNLIKDGKKTKFKELLNERDKRAIRLIELSNKIEEKNNELYSIVDENYKLQEENHDLAQQILDKTEAIPSVSNPSNPKLDQTIKRIQERIDVISNIHKLLVVESGVNWADDSSLYDLMLNLNRFSLHSCNSSNNNNNNHD